VSLRSASGQTLGCGGFVGSGYSAAVVRDGAVGFWRLDGDAKDVIGCRHGALSGGASFVAGAIVGDSNRGLSTGTFEAPYVDAVAPGSAVTLEFWSKGSTPSHQMVARIGNMQLFKWWTGETRFFLFDSPPPIITVAAETAEWRHYAFVYDGAGMAKLYVGGVLAATANGVWEPTDFTGVHGGPGKIISIPASTRDWDEVALYAKALPLATIQAHAGQSGLDDKLDLSPATGSVSVGGTHQVTATVSDASTGVGSSGVPVVLAVTAGPNTGFTGKCVPATCQSDSAGVVRWSYSGSRPGQDTISVTADRNGNGIRDPSEKQSTVIVDWLDQTTVHLPGINACLLTGPGAASVGSCTSSFSQWVVSPRSSGQFQLKTTTGNCLNYNFVTTESSGCADLFTLLREDGLREIRTGGGVSDDSLCLVAVASGPGPVVGSPCRVPAGGPTNPGLEARAGWEIRLPPQTISYQLGDTVLPVSVDPRIGKLYVVTARKGQRPVAIMCSAAVIDSANTVLTAGHCVGEVEKAGLLPFSIAKEIYFIPGYQVVGKEVRAPFGVYRATSMVFRRGKFAKGNDWAFLKMVPESRPGVGFLEFKPRVLRPAYGSLSTRVGYFPTRFKDRSLRNASRSEPVTSVGYPSNLSFGYKQIQCGAPNRTDGLLSDRIACWSGSGSSGGPMFVAGEVVGNNESTLYGILHFSILSRLAYNDYQSLPE
jgi:hypothetical protein